MTRPPLVCGVEKDRFAKREKDIRIRRLDYRRAHRAAGRPQLLLLNHLAQENGAGPA